MARWVSSRQPRTVLDPAIGSGILLHECALKLNRKDVRLVGVDRDSIQIERAINTAPRGAELFQGDYLRLTLPTFDGIIANPPYVKSHRLDYSETDWLAFERQFNISLSRLTNIYALFLLKIWADLTAEGRAAIIIPAEFMNANFGTPIKRLLQEHAPDSGIALFDPAASVFQAAMTTSCIVFLKKTGTARTGLFAAQVFDQHDLESFVSAMIDDRLDYLDLTDLSQVPANEKWINRVVAPRNKEVGSTQSHKLGEFFRCMRGIATGANDYFCLKESERMARHLNQAHFVPCVCRATDISGLVFDEKEFSALVKADKKTWLLNPMSNDPQLTAYLDEGKKVGIAGRYLPSHRPIWYLPEDRRPADLLVPVFSRGAAKFIMNLARVRNLTCFHALYCKSENPLLPYVTLVFLNSLRGQQGFHDVNRFYGDGLLKLEPKDVEQITCPDLLVATERASQIKGFRQNLVEAASKPLSIRQPYLEELASLLF